MVIYILYVTGDTYSFKSIALHLWLLLCLPKDLPVHTPVLALRRKQRDGIMIPRFHPHLSLPLIKFDVALVPPTLKLKLTATSKLICNELSFVSLSSSPSRATEKSLSMRCFIGLQVKETTHYRTTATSPSRITIALCYRFQQCRRCTGLHAHYDKNHPQVTMRWIL